MKNSSGTKKIAVKAGSFDSALYQELVEQDPGAKKRYIEPGLTAYIMSDGSTIEIYGAGFCCPDYLFAYGNVVVSFRVTNIDEMVASLQQKGAAILGRMETVCSSYRYCHLLTKEKTVVGIYEVP